MRFHIAGTVLATTLMICGSLQAQTIVSQGRVSQISVHTGEMSATISGTDDKAADGDSIRFEPYQALGDIFRSDIVYLMRHGPTDWSKRDLNGVEPTDCSNQRIMHDQGVRDMENLGVLMMSNDIRPGKVIVSQWCRNQQTVDALLRGMKSVDPEFAESLDIETSADLNLLLSLNGAPNVSAMREMITNWDGGDDKGPLLLISHFTNIDELTEFHVYEGEMLLVDPKRSNRVLGYLRLSTASPDVGHFN